MGFRRLSRSSLATIVLLLAAQAAPAQDDSKVKAGLAVWRGSGCAECHGAFANGEKEESDAPAGANLRQTRLDAAALSETIRCGRPGTGMPGFDADAFTKRGCYGQPTGPVPDGAAPPPRTLNADEIDAMVAYLKAWVIGRGAVTPEECAFYYGDAADSECDNNNR